MSIIRDTTHIEIRGNEVCLVRTQVQKRVKTEEFAKKMGELRPVSSGLQPKECIYYQHWTRGSSPHSLYVVEWEPRRVSLQYRNRDFRALDIGLYEVIFPYTQWYFHCISGRVMRLHVSCTAHRIKQMDDKLWEMPLPNQETSGFCQGEIGAKPNLPTHSQCEQLLTDVISSIWNDDLSPNWELYGLHDNEATRAAQVAHDEMRSAYRAKHAELEGKLLKMTKSDTPEYKATFKAWTEHKALYPELEKPSALQFLAAKGIPLWAQKYKDEGEDYWHQLIKREHFMNTFDRFVAHLCESGR